MRLPVGERHELAPSHCHYSVERSVPYARPCHRVWLKHRAKKAPGKKAPCKKAPCKKGGLYCARLEDGPGPSADGLCPAGYATFDVLGLVWSGGVTRWWGVVVGARCESAPSSGLKKGAVHAPRGNQAWG